MAAESDFTQSILHHLRIGVDFTSEQVEWLTKDRVRGLERRLNLPLTGDVRLFSANFDMCFLTKHTPPDVQFQAAMRSNDVGFVERELSDERLEKMLNDMEGTRFLCTDLSIFRAYTIINLILFRLQTLAQSQGFDVFTDFVKEKRKILRSVIFQAAGQGLWPRVLEVLNMGIKIHHAFHGAVTLGNMAMISQLEAHVTTNNLEPSPPEECFMFALLSGHLPMAQHHYSKISDPGKVKSNMLYWAISGCNVSAIEWASQVSGQELTKDMIIKSNILKPNIIYFEFMRQLFGDEFVTSHIKQNIEVILDQCDHDLLDYASQHAMIDWKFALEYYTNGNAGVACLWSSLISYCAEKLKSDDAMDDLEITGILVPENLISYCVGELQSDDNME